MRSEGQNPKILIVDDSKESIDLITYFLKSQSYEIMIAMNGEEALDAVGQKKPDLILLDVMLPKIDGFKVCETLKKSAETRSIPIIMITALKELKDKIRGLEAGADDFISKPFDNVELMTRVKSLLRLKNYHDELVRKNQKLEELNQFKEELTHLIVHDMKNPLFVIQGNVQMMEMGLGESIPDVAKKYMGRIDRSTQNLLRIVLDLIDVYKIEEDSMNLSEELISINELVEKSYQRLLDYPENSKKQFDVSLAENMPFIKLDNTVMERVLDNLLSFATGNVDPDGKVDLNTFTTDDEVGLIIQDHGIQIPLKYSKTMFEKYDQIKIKNDGYRLGRGLALTFSKLAVEAHGGNLIADEENKDGNRFIMTFPKKK